MTTRVAASLLALIVLAASGFTNGVAYLCAMDGNAHSACCCPSEDETDDRGARIDRADCCEVQVADTAHAPATSETARRVGALEPAPAPAPDALASAPSPSGPGIEWPPDVRGPPSDGGPALFVRHCRYLI